MYKNKKSKDLLNLPGKNGTRAKTGTHSNKLDKLDLVRKILMVVVHWDIRNGLNPEHSNAWLMLKQHLDPKRTDVKRFIAMIEDWIETDALYSSVAIANFHAPLVCKPPEPRFGSSSVGTRILALAKKKRIAS